MNRFWWRLKVACGSALIVILFYHYLGDPAPAWIPRWCGQALVLLGGVITLYHGYILARAKPRQGNEQTLVTDTGLYRWTRHPMYTGDAILYLGLVALAPGFIAAALFLLGAYALYRQARVEDQWMLEQHGEIFEAWRLRTRLL